MKGAASVLQGLGTVGAAIDGVMAVYDFANTLINGPQPSPEMAFMKAEFKVVNSKLDKVLAASEGLENLAQLAIAIKDVNLVATDSLVARLPGIMALIQRDTRRNTASLKTKNKVENFVGDVKTEKIITGLVFEPNIHH